MSEHEAIRKLLALAAAEALEEGELRRVEEHLRECSSCAAEWDAWRALARGMRGLPTPVPADLGPLLALFRELCVETSAPMRDPEARAKLAMLDGAGATARLARALLDDAPAA